MKVTFLMLAACCVVNVFAQHSEKEINDQVWETFIQTFNDHDTDGFLALHSKDVVRSPRDSKAVWNWDEYYQQQKKEDDQEKTSGLTRELELRFTERLSNKDRAVDVGIYKTTVTQRNGKTQSFYGRFHVVLRKENNLWRILVDTDSSEGETITEQDFINAKTME